MAKCFFHGERTSKMANLFKISHEMANLATLASSILNALWTRDSRPIVTQV